MSDGQSEADIVSSGPSAIAMRIGRAVIEFGLGNEEHDDARWMLERYGMIRSSETRYDFSMCKALAIAEFAEYVFSQAGINRHGE